MQSLIDKMAICIDNEDDEKFAKHNKEFHKYLYRQSPLKGLYDMIVNLWDGGKSTSAIFALNPDRMVKSQDEHHLIMEAIVAKDEQEIERIIRDFSYSFFNLC